MKKFACLSAVAAIALSAQPAVAQGNQQPSAQDRLGSIFGALFGDRLGVTTSIEAQWAAGRTPLLNQRNQFESRVDAEVRSGVLNQATATRLKFDYGELVQLETRYGADRRFSAQERSDLASRYAALTQVLSTGSYGDGETATTAVAAEEQTEFNRRVDAAVAARRLTRIQGTRLKTDYAAAVRVETGYLRDGVLSPAERNDLDARLEALDARVGDTAGSTVTLTPRARLDAIARALPTSGLSAAARAQLLVEHEDLSRLEAAYARLNVTAGDRAYLDQRIADLEVRARVR